MFFSELRGKWMKLELRKAKAASLIAAVLNVSLVAILAGGCEKAKSDPAAEAPPAATVEHQNDLNLVKVDKPERFPLVEAAAHDATSEPQRDRFRQSRRLAGDSGGLDRLRTGGCSMSGWAITSTKGS
jgi:hypothetical protein